LRPCQQNTPDPQACQASCNSDRTDRKCLSVVLGCRRGGGSSKATPHSKPAGSTARPLSMNYARFAKLPEEILHARELSPSDRLVYAEMAFQAWYKDTCYISQAKISARTGVSARQVRRSQAKLEAERYITGIDTGLHKVTTYRLNSRVFAPRKKPNYADIMSSSQPQRCGPGVLLSRNSKPKTLH